MFLDETLFFAWKSILNPRENNKLLRNMSKLLVSRLIARFNKLSDKVTYIFQLFRSVSCEIEDIIDDETKHIWIRTCQTLLPQIKTYNLKFPENRNKSNNYWN